MRQLTHRDLRMTFSFQDPNTDLDSFSSSSSSSSVLGFVSKGSLNLLSVELAVLE